MAWIYLAASAVSPLPYRHGFDPSPTVKTTHTRSRYFCPECQKGICQLHPFGTMCELSKWEYFLAASPSTSSMAASHARTLALQALESAWTASARGFSGKSKDLSKKYSHVMSFLKTCQRSGRVACQMFVEHLPPSGMIVAGRLYQPQKLELRTLEKDGSCLLPTPSACSVGTNLGGAAGRVGKVRPSLQTMARKNLWPTATARDWKSGSMGTQGNSRPLSEQVGGQLNPTWVEWLMGYRAEWTVLKPWATLWFQSKREKRL